MERVTSVENWLDRHLEVVALAVVAGGFAARLLAASGSYLNADEAIQYVLANQPSVDLAYKAALTNAHPPLHVLLLHLWRFLGHSEWLLRLPSVLAGTAFCWVTFKWISMTFGRAAGLISLILAAFTPALIALSAEVRGYSLLLLFMVSSLYFFERALREPSVRRVLYSSLFLYLALLSHYSAVFFAVAAGAYSLARLGDSRRPRSLVVAWLGGQAGGMLLCVFLYVSQLANFTGAFAASLMEPYQREFFRLGQEDLLSLTRHNTSRMFLFLFQEPHVSQAILWCFAASVAFLLVRELLPGRGHDSYRHMGILLLLPFVLLWGASIAGAYPYVASRHSAFLAPLILAGTSWAFSVLQGRKLTAGLMTAVVLMGVSNAWGRPLQPYISSENQSRSLMIDAMRQMKQSVAPGELVLLDRQSRFLIAYYLCDPQRPTWVPSWPETERFECGELAVVSLNDLWKLVPASFPPRFEDVARAYGLKPGDRVWVFQAGWGLNLDTVLLEHVPQFRCLRSRTFGENIAVIPFVVGPDLLPAAAVRDCSS
jgi:hypothetical protein